MADINGFVLERAPLRALFHAQGAMTGSQNRILLFYAADVIAASSPYLPPDTHGESIKSAAALAPLKDNPYKIHSLMEFEVNGTLSAALDVLADITAADLGKDNTALQNLVSRTHDYIAMARRIQNPDYTTGLVHMSEIDPALAAAFITAYTKHFIHPHIALAANINRNPLIQQDNTAKTIKRLYETAQTDTDYIAILLDDLSAHADYCRALSQKLMNSDEYDPAMYRLHSLFQSSAIFDWRQYETGAPRPAPRQTAAAILPFKLARG